MKKIYNRPTTDAVEISALGVLMASVAEKPAAVISNGSNAIQTPTSVDTGNLF